MKYLLLFLILFSSCTYIPKNSDKAKRKISKHKDKIDRIAAYHNIDSTWIETKEIEILIPKIQKIVEIKHEIIDNSTIDSVIINNCKNIEKVKQSIKKSCLPTEPIYYSDSLLNLKFTIKPDGVFVQYHIKQRKAKKKIESKKTIINANIKYYKERGFWFVIGIMLIFFFLIKKYL